MKSISIKGTKREVVGKKETKRLRAEGLVPGVLYGGEAPIHFYAPEKEFKSLIYTPHVYLVDLDIDGTVYQSIIKDSQFHPVEEQLLHVDFLRTSEDKMVKVEIPIKVDGFAKGIRKGGKLKQNLRTLKVKAMVKHLPDFIEINVDDLDLDIFIKNLKYTLDTSFIDTLRNSTITIAFCMIGNGANGISSRGEVFELNKKLLYTFCEKLENLNKSNKSNYCINSVLNYLSNVNKTMAGTSLFDYYPFSIKDITDNYNNNLIVLKNIDLNKYFYKKGISLPPKVSNSTNGTTNLDTSNDYNLIGIENPNEIYQEPYTPKEQTKIIDDAYYFIVFNSFDESNDIEKHFRLLANNCASNINTPALGSVRNKVIYVNNTAPGSSVIEKNINATLEIMKIIKKNNLKKVSITFFDPPSCASSMLLSPSDAYKKVFDSETDFALLEMPLDNVITLTYVDMMHKDSEYDPVNIDKTKLHNVFCNTIFSAKLKKFQKIHITRLDRITIGTLYKIFPKYQDILQTMSFYDNIKIKGTNYTNNYPLPAELSTIIRDKSKPIYTYNFAYKKDNSTSYSEVKYVDNEDKLKNFSAFQLLKYFYDTRIYNTTLKPMDVYITETLQVINNLLTNDYNILYTPADRSIPGTVDVAREMNLEKLPDKTLYDYKRIKDYDTKNYEFQTNTKLINKQPENCENANFIIDYTCPN